MQATSRLGAAAPLSTSYLHRENQNKEKVAAGSLGEILWLAENQGFLVAIPNGVETDPGLSGLGCDYHWNHCRAVAGVSGTSADDVGFVAARHDWALAAFPDLDRDSDLDLLLTVGNGLRYAENTGGVKAPIFEWLAIWQTR
ncbi:MAG: hypothetical protein AB8G23_05395 [Myxococcota bacterium]